jgi:serine/threonine protein kinase/TPR repeat protein
LAAAPSYTSSIGAEASRPRPHSFGSGRYRAIRLLGEGSNKKVYLARDTSLDRDVAIAVLRTEGLDEAGRARVRREAKAMARLGDHPNVVTVFDVGEENGQPFIVSQYMAGGTVEDLLARSANHRLPIDKVLNIALEACEALGHAHSCGIVHRDFKPGNIFLTQDGKCKLGDFGLALTIGQSRLTAANMIVGTVSYMPPEGILGRPLDARGDLYSLGATLYDMITGQPPFVGDDLRTILAQHLTAVPVPPSAIAPGTPRALDEIVLALLKKDPADRPPNAAAVRSTLRILAASPKTSMELLASSVVLERTNLSLHLTPAGTFSILFSDIENSTVMNERLGDQKFHEVLQAHNSIIRRQVESHRGFEVKSMGDGFMVTFSSARRALECAIGIQREFAAYDDQHPRHPIQVRIGLHVGEAIKEGGDFFGRSVNMAARIGAKAQGGTILVSSTFREVTEGSGGFRFDQGREFELQGFSGTHRLYQVAWRDEERTCPSCSKRIPASSHSCPNCSTLLPAMPFSPPPRPDEEAHAGICKKCGRGIPSDARFCPYCSADLTPRPALLVSADQTADFQPDPIAPALLLSDKQVAGFQPDPVASGQAWRASTLLAIGAISIVITGLGFAATYYYKVTYLPRQHAVAEAQAKTEQEAQAQAAAQEAEKRKAAAAADRTRREAEGKAASQQQAAAKARYAKLNAQLAKEVAALRQAKVGSETEKQLREDAISIALQMDPPPEIPEAARQLLRKADGTMNRATTSPDYRAAAEKYRRALWLTPWLALGYRRLAEAEEKAGNLEGAVGALNYYAVGMPETSDRAEVFKKVAAIQAQIEALKNEAERKQQAEAQAKLEASKKEAERKQQAEAQAKLEASKKEAVRKQQAEARAKLEASEKDLAEKQSEEKRDDNSADISTQASIEPTSRSPQVQAEPKPKQETPDPTAVCATSLRSKDYAAALPSCQKAAAHGDSHAQNNLGLMYQNGLGVPKDNAEALNWYRKAATQGNAAAQNSLGEVYLYGVGTRPNYIEALDWYQKAATQGVPNAMFSLGYMYEQGLGVEVNNTRAVEWYQKAARLGSADAKKRLGVETVPTNPAVYTPPP